MQPARLDLPVTPGTTYRDTVRLQQPVNVYHPITAISGSPVRLTVAHGLTSDAWPVWVRHVTGMPDLNRAPPQQLPHRARVIDADTLEINARSAAGLRPLGGELVYLQPVDLTGADVEMPIMRDGQLLMTLALGAGLAITGPGSIARELTAEQTEQLGSAPADYWLEVTYSDGAVLRHQVGQLRSERCGEPLDTNVIVQGEQGPAGPVDSALVLAAALGEFTTGVTGPVLEGDSVQLALEKLQRQLDALGTIPLPPTISISAIGGDGDLTALEAASVTIAGVTSAANGSVVTVSIGGTVLGTAPAAGGAWSLAALNLTAYADAVSRTVSAVVGGVTATTPLVVREPIPVPPTISINAIGGDNDITAAEAASVTISGITSAANGAVVAVAIGGVALGSTPAAAGAWSLAGVNLTAYADGSSHDVTATVGGVTATAALTIRAAGPALPAPLPGITTLWIYDASIGAGIASGFEAVMASYMAEVHGLTLTVVNKSVSGQSLEQIAARYEAEKSSIAGNAGVMIVTMPIGNNIDGPWDTRTESYRNALITNYAAFIASIRANGNVAMPVNTTFRNRDMASVNNEANSSLPYNEHVVWPVAGAITPTMWYDGLPYLDPYNVARNWYSIALAPGDPTHYTAQGYHQLRTLYLDAIAARIFGHAPPRVVRVADPTLNQTPPLLPAMLQFAPGGSFSKSTTVYWSMQRGQSFAGTARLINMDGYDPSRLSYVGMALEASGNNSGVFNSGNRSKSLLNDGVKNSYVQTTSLVYVQCAQLTGFDPGQSVRVEFLACRSAAGATNRYGQYTLDGGATMLEVNCAYSPGETPAVHELVGVANSSGELTMSMRCRAGSGFAYLNGIIATPL